MLQVFTWCFLFFRNFVRFHNPEQFSNWQYLFVSHSILNTAAKWLCSSETWWTRQTVVARFSILTPVHSIEYKAGIRNLFALKWVWEKGEKVSIVMSDSILPFCFLSFPFKGRTSYLINILAVNTITMVASRTGTTLPGAIRGTGACSPRKAGIRQTPICETSKEMLW